MKRDMDLVRKILLACVEVPSGVPVPQTPAIEGHTDEEVRYHAHLMGQAGLLKVVDARVLSDANPQALILSVTWSGHDFADSAKSPAVWEGAKTVLNKIGGAGFDVTLEVLKQVAKEKLKDFGIDLS